MPLRIRWLPAEINQKPHLPNRREFRPLDSWNKKGTMFFLCSNVEEAFMLKTFVEEAAALASIVLFVGMIAVWAQLIPQL
jgi:hypothetical protein